MNYRMIFRLSFFVLILLVIVSLISAFAANINVPSTRLTDQRSAITADSLKPATCSGITLTTIVYCPSGGAICNGSAASELILGSANIRARTMPSLEQILSRADVGLEMRDAVLEERPIALEERRDGFRVGRLQADVVEDGPELGTGKAHPSNAIRTPAGAVRATATPARKAIHCLPSSTPSAASMRL